MNTFFHVHNEFGISVLDNPTQAICFILRFRWNYLYNNILQIIISNAFTWCVLFKCAILEQYRAK